MIDYTTIIAVDNAHVEELKLSAPTWAKLKPDILQNPVLVMRDLSCDHAFILDVLWGKCNFNSKITFIDWDWRPDLPQRERMLTAFVHASRHVKTPWYLKLDTDCLAVAPGPVYRDEWFENDPVIVSSPWSYSKPADAIQRLDDWGDTLFRTPRLDIPVAPGANKVKHKRIISWCMFGQTAWTRRALALAGGDRLPVPSQDTFLFYVAARTGHLVNRVRMKHHGWAHASNRCRLAEASRLVMEDSYVNST